MHLQINSRLAIWCIGPAIAIFAYCYGLDSIHIPNIGDETLYFQICRKTAESGHWLPLVSEKGIRNTKPPLIFWQGIVATNKGKSWTLWRLRLPIVFMTFCIALLAGWLTGRIAGNALVGLLAGLVYLGFMSSVQQGRPFLTNAPETLFLFIPLVVVVTSRELRWPHLLICGLSLGAASLAKSFFLVFAGTFSLGLVLLCRSGFSLPRFIKDHAPFLTAILLIGLGIFSLWFILDPRPDMVFKQFMIGENAGKLKPENFLKDLFVGRYSVWRIWLGDFANAGLYAFLLLGLTIDAFKRRKALSQSEKELWWFILGFLILYTIPTQRQENYILPTCAALAVLLALRWESLPSFWYRLTYGILTILFLGSFWIEYEVNRSLHSSLFSPANYALAGIFAALAIYALIDIRHIGRTMLPVAVLGVLITGSAFLAPFSRHFSPSTSAQLNGKAVYFPSNFQAAQEKYRFILPGADIKGYPGDPSRLDPGVQYAAMMVTETNPPPPGFTPIEAINNLRSRHTNKQIHDILFNQRFDLLVNRLTILERIDTTAAQ